MFESEFQDMMKRLNTMLSALGHQYDLYFNGAIKLPPNKEAGALLMFVKQCDSKSLSIPQQFIYDAFSNKYRVYTELWNKKAKDKEEGRVKHLKDKGVTEEDKLYMTLKDDLKIGPNQFKEMMQRKKDELIKGGAKVIKFVVVEENGKKKLKARVKY